ncbi:hypothetical protein LTS10_003165 [Elasticomyces elasticus]|nr:hypothetical protein LTS10_003165 [Elasticomyces elasticus]
MDAQAALPGLTFHIKQEPEDFESTPVLFEDDGLDYLEEVRREVPEQSAELKTVAYNHFGDELELEPRANVYGYVELPQTVSQAVPKMHMAMTMRPRLNTTLKQMNAGTLLPLDRPKYSAGGWQNSGTPVMRSFQASAAPYPTKCFKDQLLYEPHKHLLLCGHIVATRYVQACGGNCASSEFASGRALGDEITCGTKDCKYYSAPTVDGSASGFGSLPEVFRAGPTAIVPAMAKYLSHLGIAAFQVYPDHTSTLDLIRTPASRVVLPTKFEDLETRKKVLSLLDTIPTVPTYETNPDLLLSDGERGLQLYGMMQGWQPFRMADTLLVASGSVTCVSRDSANSSDDYADQCVRRNQETAAAYVKQHLGGSMPETVTALHFSQHASLDALPGPVVKYKGPKKTFADLMFTNPGQTKLILGRGIDTPCVVADLWHEWLQQMETHNPRLADDVYVAFAVPAEDASKEIVAFTKAWKLKDMISAIRATPQIAEWAYLQWRWEVVEKARRELVEAAGKYAAVKPKRNRRTGVVDEGPKKKRRKQGATGLKIDE